MVKVIKSLIKIVGRSVLVYSPGFNVNGSRPVSLWFHFQQLILVEMDQDKVASRVARPGQARPASRITGGIPYLMLQVRCRLYRATQHALLDLSSDLSIDIDIFLRNKFSLFQENIRFIIELSQYQVLSCLLGWYQDMVPARYRDEQAQTFSSRNRVILKST